ncbi:MAG: aminotransferase class I/II-fold pyridoxal phosphate-dependent enzyme [Bacteroidota bacterium]
MKKTIGFDSLCAKESQEIRTTKPHQLPIYATSSFEFASLEEGIAIFKGEQKGDIYSRFGNPTIDGVAEKIAQLAAHGTDVEAAALLFSSGMAAISTLLLSELHPGDTILTQGNIYGGTTMLLYQVLEPLGIRIETMDLRKLNQVEERLKQDNNIKLLYFETPANPTMECVPMAAIAQLAEQYQCISVADNTFSTPYLQQPLRAGIDYVIHSTTKYLNGHGNSVAGVLIGRDKERIQGPIFSKLKLLGTNCNAWDAWLTGNGLRTLGLRMQRHCENAQAVAEFLQTRPGIVQVNYPGLPSHPDYAVAKKQMRGFGGMLSFELAGGLAAGMQFVERSQFCKLAPTLGDVDTLIMHPASMSHSKIKPEVRRQYGITDGLVRLSIGIENVEDILEDLEQALA